MVPEGCQEKMKQLNIDVSPTANNIMTFRLGLIHATFDLDPRDLCLTLSHMTLDL